VILITEKSVYDYDLNNQDQYKIEFDGRHMQHVKLSNSLNR
jgi:hypothetical protein